MLYVLCIWGVCMYQEAEHTPCDNRSQLADFGCWQQKCSWGFENCFQNLSIFVHWLWLHWSQADQGTPVQESSGCASEFCVILCQLHHHLEILSCEQDQLLWTSSTVWKTLCKADMLLCFVGRSLGPALYRAVVLGGLSLAQNMQTSITGLKWTNWFENCDIDLWTTVTNWLSSNRMWVFQGSFSSSLCPKARPPHI